MKVLVTGGTGFIGPKVVHALRAQGREVRALARRPERASRLATWGAEVVAGDVTDAESVRAAAAGCTHVVHLVAIIRGKPADFDRVMTQGTRNVVAAAKDAGVERFILMSALGTDDTVPYYRAKTEEEQAVKESGLEYVIFQPSFVFGRDGGALPTFIRQVRYAPVVTVIGPGLQKSQPIWVEDVAEYFARAIDDPHAANRTFELGGPDVVDWNELYRAIAKTLGKHRRYVHVPFGVARQGARIPGAPITGDQVEMLAGADNIVSDEAAVQTFGLPLVPLAEQLRRAV
jgi:NADH dehydrogenase